jgi:hypothetical protein
VAACVPAAAFAKIMQEAEQGTFVSLGGLYPLAMDVASFAGGFVCNPTILNNIAKKIGETFPQFETSVRWQFDWAVCCVHCVRAVPKLCYV